jgi:hypothetical protein
MTNENKEIIPSTPKPMQYHEIVDMESLRRSWQQVDPGAKVGMMRNMEFGAGGRTKTYVNNSSYHRAAATMSAGKP